MTEPYESSKAVSSQVEPSLQYLRESAHQAHQSIIQSRLRLRLLHIKENLIRWFTVLVEVLSPASTREEILMIAIYPPLLWQHILLQQRKKEAKNEAKTSDKAILESIDLRIEILDLILTTICRTRRCLRWGAGLRDLHSGWLDIVDWWKAYREKREYEKQKKIYYQAAHTTAASNNINNEASTNTDVSNTVASKSNSTNKDIHHPPSPLQTLLEPKLLALLFRGIANFSDLFYIVCEHLVNVMELRLLQLLPTRVLPALVPRTAFNLIRIKQLQGISEIGDMGYSFCTIIAILLEIKATYNEKAWDGEHDHANDREDEKADVTSDHTEPRSCDERHIESANPEISSASAENASPDGVPAESGSLDLELVIQSSDTVFKNPLLDKGFQNPSSGKSNLSARDKMQQDIKKEDGRHNKQRGRHISNLEYQDKETPEYFFLSSSSSSTKERPDLESLEDVKLLLDRRDYSIERSWIAQDGETIAQDYEIPTRKSAKKSEANGMVRARRRSLTGRGSDESKNRDFKSIYQSLSSFLSFIRNKTDPEVQSRLLLQCVSFPAWIYWFTSQYYSDRPEKHFPHIYFAAICHLSAQFFKLYLITRDASRRLANQALQEQIQRRSLSLTSQASLKEVLLDSRRSSFEHHQRDNFTNPNLSNAILPGVHNSNAILPGVTPCEAAEIRDHIEAARISHERASSLNNDNNNNNDKERLSKERRNSLNTGVTRVIQTSVSCFDLGMHHSLNRRAEELEKDGTHACTTGMKSYNLYMDGNPYNMGHLYSGVNGPFPGGLPFAGSVDNPILAHHRIGMSLDNLLTESSHVHTNRYSRQSAKSFGLAG